MTTADLRAPFPWFGGKSRVADVVWQRFGDVPNYVEPFAGSLAVLLARPHEPKIETANDANAFVANFWRCFSDLRNDPEHSAWADVAAWADWPVNEADLHARHKWLVAQQDFAERMKADPDYYDAKIAGWWVWGICQWIGSGWCERPEWGGRTNAGRAARGMDAARLAEKLPAVGNGGRGVHRVHRKRPHLMTGGKGILAARASAPSEQLPHLGNAGRGEHRAPTEKLPILSAGGQGVHRPAHESGLYDYFAALHARLRRVRICCGDWSRVMGPSVTTKLGVTGVFLDPPYDGHEHLYAEANRVSREVREWAVKNGGNPMLRIALCGLEGEHDMPESWECFAWKAAGGYASQGPGKSANASRERIWFSPACLRPQMTLFDHEAA